MLLTIHIFANQLKHILIFAKNNIFFNFRREEVLSFGLWQNSCLKIFVRKGTDEQKLRTDLSDVDKDFFEKHKIEFEQGKLVKKHTLMQGDSVQRMEGKKHLQEPSEVLSQMKKIPTKNML